MSWNRSGTRNYWLCRTLLTLAVLLFIISLTLNGCLSARKSTVYVPDSQRLVMQDVNEPAPFKGVLITQGYFFYLKKCEGLCVEHNLKP